MNNYWIGKWFPFSDEKGFVKDQKSVLSVGSLVALLSSKNNKLGSFRINTENLRRDLISNANYIGNIKSNIMIDFNMSLKDEESEFIVTALPFRIGFKKLDASNYPSRNLYTIDINKSHLFEKFAGDLNKVDNLIFKIRESMPLKFEVSRDLDKCKEKLFITDITDNEDNNLNKNYFELQLNTLQDIKGYWLDEGEFILKV